MAAEQLAAIPVNIDLKGNSEVSKPGGLPTSSDKPTTLVEAINGKLGAPEQKAEVPRQLDSEKFAALARKERALVKQQQALKVQMQQLQQFQEREAQFNQLKSNPLKALKALGISYDQLTNYILNNQQPTPDMQVAAVKSEVEAVKKQLEEEKRQAADMAKRQKEAEFAATSQEFDKDINKFVEENAAKYELVNMHAGQPIMRATIEQHFKNTGKILGIDEAAQLVEDYLEEQIKKSLESSKFKAKQEPKEGQGVPSKEMGSKQTTSTLNNGMTSSAPTLLSAKTEADRIQRAMAALSKAS